MISFNSGFTAASSRVGLMKRQRRSIPRLTVIPSARMTNWIIPLNFVNHKKLKGSHLNFESWEALG